MRRLSPILVLIVSLYLVPAASGAAGDLTTDRDCLRFLRGVDLQSATIPQLQSALAKKRFTSVELVQRYLARIDAFRKYDAIRAINPDDSKSRARATANAAPAKSVGHCTA